MNNALTGTQTDRQTDTHTYTHMHARTHTHAHTPAVIEDTTHVHPVLSLKHVSLHANSHNGGWSHRCNHGNNKIVLLTTFVHAVDVHKLRRGKQAAITTHVRRKVLGL